MPKLPLITAPKAIKAFSRAGFMSIQIRGSHHQMRHPETRRKLSIPDHGAKPLGKGLLLSLIFDAGLTKDEFIKLLKK